MLMFNSPAKKGTFLFYFEQVLLFNLKQYAVAAD